MERAAHNLLPLPQRRNLPVKYEPVRLAPKIGIALFNMFRLIDKHMSDMPVSYRGQFAAAFFQGVAETYAIENYTGLANNAVAVSLAFARHGYDAVLEAHTKELRNVGRTTNGG
jgi:hypothetical protein